MAQPKADEAVACFRLTKTIVDPLASGVILWLAGFLVLGGALALAIHIVVTRIRQTRPPDSTIIPSRKGADNLADYLITQEEYDAKKADILASM